MSKLNNNADTASSEPLTSLFIAALNSTQSGVIITDNRVGDNPIIFCNDSFERLTGYRKDEIIGKNCRFLQNDDRDQSVLKRIRNALQLGESVTAEIRNYKKNGELFWNELHLSPVKDEWGKITHFVGIQIDITEKKIVEQKNQSEHTRIESIVESRTKSLQEVQDYLNSIVQTIKSSLLVLDSEFFVLTANQEFFKMFQVTETETVGKKLYELGNRQWDIAPLKTLLEKILPTSNPVLNFEVRHDFPKIGNRLMLLNAYRIELEGEFKDRILISIEDETEKREIQQRKDDFLSIASHELKTPLTSLSGFLQVAKKLSSDVNSKLSQVIDKAYFQTRRISALVEELLDVSRIHSGKMQMHLSELDLNELLQDIVEHVKILDHKIVITIEGRAKNDVVGDESKLRQVLNNLLENAIKYSPGEKLISILVTNLSDVVKVSVKDKGIGIKVEDQSKIFEKFYRVSDIQKNYPGIGIGLYFCENVISQHGGVLTVESVEGEGSTFSFTLPLKVTN